MLYQKIVYIYKYSERSKELSYLADKGNGRCEEDAHLSAGFADEVSKLVHE